MASTYVNNLRLNEMATGDGSGTWGTTTNTNLELIGQAFGWGTRAIANASTDNITIADGASDADRNMALKLTGGGQACTVTILPNTSSKVWIMENATSYTLTFTQGSGANVAILAGETKMIATDGLGSGAVVYDVLTDLNLAGTTKAAALTVAGVLTTTATQVATGGITSGSNIVSDTDSTDDLGTTSVRWANLYVDAITATDQITATGFTGTLDGILGSGAAAAATVTTLDTSGAVNLNLVTDSTSSTSGALIVDGGVGIAKKLYVGTDLDVDGTLEADAITLNGTALGSLYSPIAGGSGIVTTGAINSGSITSGFGTINNGASTITTTGAVATGAITAGGNITRGGTVILDGSITDTGVFTIDTAGAINLDSSGDANFMVTGTTYASFSNNGGNAQIYVPQSDKDFLIKGNDGGSTITALTLDMSAAGAATFNNDVTAFSDERLKSNITTIPDALSKVTEMRGVHYVRNETGKDSSGVIAQELQKIAPELVLTAEDEMGTLSVNYGNITGYLIEAVKELSARVKELEGK